MIALVTTYFLVSYILLPGALFRFFTSWFVPLKLFERTRTQEATFAVAVAVLPFALALAGVWFVPGMRTHPFRITPQTNQQRRQDYRRVVGMLVSSDPSRLLAGNITQSASAATETNWGPLNRVLRRQARFLIWYFFFTACEGLAFGFLARNYGNWKILEDTEFTATVPRPNAFIRLYNWIAPKLILPHLSEWYTLLTDFAWPRRENIFVRADVLQNDGKLYQGRVATYFTDSAGKLTGILLKQVSRFDREGYLDAKAKAQNPESVTKLQYWRNIPSQNFYIGQSSISNLNVRFVPRDETLISLAESILDEKNSETYQVDVLPQTPGLDPPDVYS